MPLRSLSPGLSNHLPCLLTIWDLPTQAGSLFRKELFLNYAAGKETPTSRWHSTGKRPFWGEPCWRGPGQQPSHFSGAGRCHLASCSLPGVCCEDRAIPSCAPLTHILQTLPKSRRVATLGDVAELRWLQVEGLSEVNYCFQAPWPPIDSSINTNGKHASVRPFPLGVFTREDISGCTEGACFSLPSLPVLWELQKFSITDVKNVKVWIFFCGRNS